MDVELGCLAMTMELGGALVGAAYAGFYKDNQWTLYWLVVYSLIGFVAFKEANMLNSGYVAEVCFLIGYIAMFSFFVTSLLNFNMPKLEGLILIVCLVVVVFCLFPEMYMKEKAKRADEKAET